VSHNFARQVSGEGVTVAEWVMLRSLHGSAPIAPSALARKRGMTNGAISKLADSLLDKALIERRANPEDKRGPSLSLPPAGQRKVPILAALAEPVTSRSSPS
jgi:DNA-binding MarR family transcriptional regulator